MNKTNKLNWLTTEDIAEHLGVTPQTIVNWRVGYTRKGLRYPPLLEYGEHWVRYKGLALHSPSMLSMSPRDLAVLRKRRWCRPLNDDGANQKTTKKSLR